MRQGQSDKKTVKGRIRRQLKVTLPLAYVLMC